MGKCEDLSVGKILAPADSNIKRTTVTPENPLQEQLPLYSLLPVLHLMNACRNALQNFIALLFHSMIITLCSYQESHQFC